MNTITETVLASNLHEYGPHWGGGGPWFLLIPLFWVAVIVTIAVIFKKRGGGNWQRHHGAEGVLRERFARGEVTDEEYRQRLEILRGK